VGQDSLQNREGGYAMFERHSVPPVPKKRRGDQCARRRWRGLTGVAATVSCLLVTAPARATWSIVMANVETKEVAVGTVTCLANLDLLILVPVVAVGKGAGAVQAAGDFEGTRRPIVFNGLLNGTPPSDILLQLAAVPGHATRQYGIADTNGGRITFTGSSTFQWAGGSVNQIGPFVYAIQGNILVGPCVLALVEKTIADPTLDLPDKLMAGMRVAGQFGGDGRCSCSQFNPTGCGCPPPDFTKPGHIGGMIVARIGDIDDTTCPLGGCADGDYFMRLNVPFAAATDPDPVEQLQAQYSQFRSAHLGRPDAIHSSVALDTTPLPADGVSTVTMDIQLLDWKDQPITASLVSVTVVHAPDSDGLSTIGPSVDHGGGSLSVTLTAGSLAGTDRFRITVDDGTRPVVLMPDPSLALCTPGPTCGGSPTCGDNLVNQPGEACDGSDDAACPGQCLTDCTCGGPAPVCGDNVVSGGEACDPPGSVGQCGGFGGVRCQADCTCPPLSAVQRPALPGWGLAGLGLVLLAGVLVVFGRRRAVSGV
ncbi:MAG: DUF1028 domain-containing protein, partial [Phycisphaerae bacterium]